MINKNKEIKDAEDFNEYASGMLDSFLESLISFGGFTRAPTEDDQVDPDWAYVYTDAGQRLYETMKRRLIDVGENNFPDEIIDVSSYLYQEY